MAVKALLLLLVPLLLVSFASLGSPIDTTKKAEAAVAQEGLPGLPGASIGTPSLIQGRSGAQGRFELVSPSADGGLMHYWRNDDDPQMPWLGPAYLDSGARQLDLG
jgi:hypothetical protein